MASITIRNLSDDTKERLRAQAKRLGRSLESHARAILKDAAKRLMRPCDFLTI